MTLSLHIFAKNPHVCDTKTRLKSLLNDEERKYITKDMLKMICLSLSNLDYDKFLHVYPDYSNDFFKNLSKKYNLNLLNQSNDSLSFKIFSTLENFKDSYYKRILIGSDIPSISENEIKLCDDYLDDYDCVFGPSRDGGFYLIGVKNNNHNILRDLELNKIELNILKEKCRYNNLKYKLINELKDIDRAEDLLTI